MTSSPSSAASNAPQLAGGIYRVFSVDSGDRLTFLLHPSTGADGTTAVPTKGIIISEITVPKLGRMDANDEPYAYDAYEFLRAKCIGELVKFTPLFEVAPLGRTAGRVTFVKPIEQDAAEALIEAGFASFNERTPAKISPERKDLLMNMMKDAKAARRGQWGKGDAASHVRPKLPFPPASIEQFAGERKGKQFKVHVDRVQSATSLIMSTLDTHQPFLLHLTGIAAVKENPTAIAACKYHVEKFLLNRHVQVLFEGTDNFLNMQGSVVSPKGVPFQVELLKRGFVKINNVTITNVVKDENRNVLREAEKTAQDDKLFVWKNSNTVIAAPASTSAGVASGATVTAASPASPAGPVNDFKGSKDFDATLVQVVSGDMIVVRPVDIASVLPNSNETTVRLSLSGVRAAKAAKSNSGSPETRVSYDDYSWEAKELLRTKFIGKTVHVHVDYTRTIEETHEQRAAATVYDVESNVNLGAAVIQAGYAKFFLGRTDICEAATLLQDAESNAKTQGLGLHSNAKPPTHTVLELSRLGEAKGRHYLSFLQRSNTSSGGRPMLKGVVDLVNNGGSYRVHIPKEHFQIAFKLGGIIAPSQGFTTGSHDDPFFHESKDFAIRHLQQREVEIQVDTADRGGNFIGSLFLNGKNFAVTLVEAGLATLGNADRSTAYNALVAAEDAAKVAKRFIWSAPEALPARKRKMQEDNQTTDGPVRATDTTVKPVAIINVEDGNTVTVTFPQDSEMRHNVADAVKSIVSSNNNPHKPNKGEVVVALFRDDKTWHRAKVIKQRGEDYEVEYIDYNSRDEVRSKDLRKVPLDSDYHFLRTTPALATTVKIAVLKRMSVEHPCCDTACSAIWEYSERGQLYLRPEYTDGKTLYASITSTGDTNEVETLAEALLKEGVALVDKAVVAKGIVDKSTSTRALEAQEKARKAHRNLWRYGDVDSDLDEE